MKRKAVTGWLGTVLLAGSMAGLGAENPYQDIVGRNAFALKPIPEAPKPGENQPPPTSVEVLLTGISTLGGGKKVLLQITDKAPGKKPEFPPPLSEGEGQGRVDVVTIDPDKGAVVIKIDGNEKTLTFEKDAPKPGGGVPGAVPPVPGLPAPPGGILPLPGVTTAGAAAAAVNAGGTGGRYGVVVGGGAPSRTPAVASRTGIGVPGAPGMVNYGASGLSPGVSGAGVNPLVPARPLRTTAVGGEAPHVQEMRNLQQQAVNLGLIRNDSLPPMPPAPGTRTGGTGVPTQPVSQ